MLWITHLGLSRMHTKLGWVGHRRASWAWSSLIFNFYSKLCVCSLMFIYLFFFLLDYEKYFILSLLNMFTSLPKIFHINMLNMFGLGLPQHFIALLDTFT